MTRQVIIQIQSTTQTPLPKGSTFAGFRFRLVSESGSGERASEVVLDASYVFPNVEAGSYIAYVEAIDSVGTVLSAASVTGKVEDMVEEPVETYPMPGLIAFQVV